MSDRSVSVCVTHLIVVYIICFIHIQIVPAIHLTIAFHFNWLNALEKLKIFNPDEYPEKLIRNITQIPLSIVAGCAIQKDEPNLSEQQNSKKQKRKKKHWTDYNNLFFRWKSLLCAWRTTIFEMKVLLTACRARLFNAQQLLLLICTFCRKKTRGEHILKLFATKWHCWLLVGLGWIGLDWVGGFVCV